MIFFYYNTEYLNCITDGKLKDLVVIMIHHITSIIKSIMFSVQTNDMSRKRVRVTMEKGEKCQFFFADL